MKAILLIALLTLSAAAVATTVDVGGITVIIPAPANFVREAPKHGVRSSIVAFARVGSAVWLDPFASNSVVRSTT